MKDYLKSLGITKEGKMTGNIYTVHLHDSDEYGKIYSLLDKYDGLYENEEDSEISSHSAKILFEDDSYVITIYADFDYDTYRLTVRELKENEDD